jgi:hypothetical protein
MRVTALWRRIDRPGFDGCRLTRLDGDWRLNGMAVFKGDSGPACLSYEVECDDRWHARRGSVTGWDGNRSIDFSIVRRSADDIWTLNGNAVRLEGCVDLDFGFTPATNVLQLRRIALAVGQSTDVPVAWLDVDSDRLERVDQRYERRSERTYWYESPRFDYFALLDVQASGFTENYPGLWEAAG